MHDRDHHTTRIVQTKTTHHQPYLLRALISNHHNASLFPLLPTYPASRQRSLFRIFTPKDLHTLFRQARGSHRVLREHILLFMASTPAVSLTCLARIVRLPGEGGPSNPPAEGLHSLSPLTQTPHPSPGNPADCAAGPSIDFHNLIPGVAATISRIVEHILDHTVGLSLFPSGTAAILQTVRSTPDRPDKTRTLHTLSRAFMDTIMQHFVTLSSP